jgi:hypothetical protein
LAGTLPPRLRAGMMAPGSREGRWWGVVSAMYWCFSCYAVNPHPHGSCVRCGRPVEGPHGLSYDDRLVWALGHPDGDRAILAAQTLSVRLVRSVLPALRNVVDQDRDPFLNVAALRSAIAIAGRDELIDWLQKLADSDSFMGNAVARQALAWSPPELSAVSAVAGPPDEHEAPVLRKIEPLGLEQLHRNPWVAAEADDLVARVVDQGAVDVLEVVAVRTLSGKERPAALTRHQAAIAPNSGQDRHDH